MVELSSLTVKYYKYKCKYSKISGFWKKKKLQSFRMAEKCGLTVVFLTRDPGLPDIAITLMHCNHTLCQIEP